MKILHQIMDDFFGLIDRGMAKDSNNTNMKLLDFLVPICTSFVFSLLAIVNDGYVFYKLNLPLSFIEFDFGFLLINFVKAFIAFIISMVLYYACKVPDIIKYILMYLLYILILSMGSITNLYGWQFLNMVLTSIVVIFVLGIIANVFTFIQGAIIKICGEKSTDDTDSCKLNKKFCVVIFLTLLFLLYIVSVCLMSHTFYATNTKFKTISESKTYPEYASPDWIVLKQYKNTDIVINISDNGKKYSGKYIKIENLGNVYSETELDKPLIADTVFGKKLDYLFFVKLSAIEIVIFVILSIINKKLFENQNMKKQRYKKK